MIDCNIVYINNKETEMGPFGEIRSERKFGTREVSPTELTYYQNGESRDSDYNHELRRVWKLILVSLKATCTTVVSTENLNEIVDKIYFSNRRTSTRDLIRSEEIIRSENDFLTISRLIMHPFFNINKKRNTGHVINNNGTITMTIDCLVPLQLRTRLYTEILPDKQTWDNQYNQDDRESTNFVLWFNLYKECFRIMSIIRMQTTCNLQVLRSYKPPQLSPEELKFMEEGRVVEIKNPTAYHAPTMNQIMRDLGRVYHPEFALALVLGCIPEILLVPQFLLRNVEFFKHLKKIELHRPTYSDDTNFICDIFKEASDKYLSIIETLCVSKSFSHSDKLAQLDKDSTLGTKLLVLLRKCNMTYKKVQESIGDTHAEVLPVSSVRDVVQQFEEMKL